MTLAISRPARKATAVATLVVVLVAGALVWSRHAHLSGQSPHAQPPSSASARQDQVSGSPVSTFNADQARMMSQRLRSGQPSGVAEALAMPSGQAVPAQLVRQLEGLRSITFDLETAHIIPEGTGVVDATVVTADGSKQTWEVYLAYASGAWKVTATAALRTGQ